MTYINFTKRTFDGTGSDNTIEGSTIRTGGKHTTNIITLNANNTTQSINVFELTGAVDILALYGEIKTVGTLSNMTAVYFNLYDGTNTVEITKDGSTLSGFGVGSFFIKDANAATVLSVLNNDQGRIKEAASGNKTASPFLVMKKTSANTYIRLTYTTTDAPINATVEIHCSWVDINGGQIIAV
jgi:hypothetical protein